jgi:polysaccharide biosynthesis transport protein
VSEETGTRRRLGAAEIHSHPNNLATRENLPAQSHATSPTRNEPANDSIIEIVWRQRTVVAITAGISLVLAVLYLLISTRYYTGYSKLFVQQAGAGIPGMEAHAAQDPEAFLYTQREIVQSTPVVAMTLGAPGIRDLRTFAGQDNTFSYFKNSLTVDVGKKDELLSLEFDTPYKDEAVRIVDTLVTSYKDYQSKQRSSSASDMLDFLKQEVEQKTKELSRKQEELAAFEAKHGLLSSRDGKTNIVKQQLDNLTAALTAAQLETINAKTAWDDINRTVLNTPQRQEQFKKYHDDNAGFSQTAVDDATLRSQILQAEASLGVYRQKYGPKHPAILNLQYAIDQLNIQYANAVYRRWESAKGKEEDLKASFDKQQHDAIAQSNLVVAEANLMNAVDGLQKDLKDLNEKFQSVKLSQRGGAPTIQVLEPPSVSRVPTRPHVLQNLALALLGGMMVGCGIACVRDWYDFRLRSADEIKSALGVTVLGVVPHVEDETSPIARGQKIHIDPASEAAEAYRSLRTAIWFGTKEGQAKTILVTSPERGDGKTTCASNLAISIAQASRRVLLVDADMRAPMQDLIFSMNGRVGLGNVLQGKDELDVAIRHTGIENLDLLPAGIAGRNPSELLNSQRFLDLLDQLAEKYDHVVIDSPPLLAVTDARIIAASTDATVLVLRAGKSNRKLSELSIDGLVSVGAKLLGAVVNDVRRRGYRYYGSYGRYGYGENSLPTDRALEDKVNGSSGRRRDEYAATPGEEGGPLPSGPRSRLTG